MFTGKIYKNKLSAQPQQNFHQPTHDTRQITRVKSQPGIKFIPTLPKIDNVQNIEHGIVKNQRQKIYAQLNQKQYVNTYSKGYLSGSRTYADIDTTEHVMEYQRKSKDLIKKIQERYEIKLSQLEAELDAKNEIILQLKSALKEKQKVIEQLQQEKPISNFSRLSTPRYS